MANMEDTATGGGVGACATLASYIIEVHLYATNYTLHTATVLARDPNVLRANHVEDDSADLCSGGI